MRSYRVNRGATRSTTCPGGQLPAGSQGVHGAGFLPAGRIGNAPKRDGMERHVATEMQGDTRPGHHSHRALAAPFPAPTVPPRLCSSFLSGINVRCRGLRTVSDGHFRLKTDHQQTRQQTGSRCRSRLPEYFQTSAWEFMQQGHVQRTSTCAWLSTLEWSCLYQFPSDASRIEFNHVDQSVAGDPTPLPVVLQLECSGHGRAHLRV